MINIKYSQYTYKVSVDYGNYKNYEQCQEIINENLEGKKRINFWFKDFLIRLKEDLNDFKLTINIDVSGKDFIILEDIVDKFNEEEEVNFSLIQVPNNNKNNKNIFKSELIDLIKKISKIPELKDEFEDNGLFHKLNGFDKGEVPIIITATMSAGKSTLINAILEKDLLPSKNEACTASICMIKDNDDVDGFNAIVKDENGKTIEEKYDIDNAFIDRYNNDANSDYREILIEGDIKGISSEFLSLVIVDTPGPNNSQNEKHKEVTYKLIKDKKDNPLIVYVLNSQQLETNDQHFLLKEISDFIKQNGKSAEERLIFVLNKIDEFDPEKEDLDQIIKNAYEYLDENFNIKNPKIFPMSAEYAKLLTLKNSSKKITRREESTLDDFNRSMLPDKTDNYIGIDTIKYASISQDIKDKLYKEAEEDIEKAKLHYSGISAFRYYVDDYVNYNHRIDFIHNLLENVFKPIEKSINNLKLTNSISTKKEIDDIKEKLEILKKKFTKNNEIKHELEIKVNDIKVDNQFINNIRYKVNNDFNNILMNLKGEININKAQYEIKKAQDILNNLEISIKTTLSQEQDFILSSLEQKVNNVITSHYKSEINKFDLSAETKELFKSKINLKNISSQQVISKNTNTKKVFSHSEKVYTGSSYESRGLLTFITFGIVKKEVKHYKDVSHYKNEKFVNLSKVYNEDFAPISNQVINQIENVSKEFKSNIERVKQDSLAFIIPQIDGVMNNVKNEINKISNEKQIKESEKQKKINFNNLLEKYKTRIEKILLEYE